LAVWYPEFHKGIPFKIQKNTGTLKKQAIFKKITPPLKENSKFAAKNGVV